jgi:hypothetical protein
METDTTKKIVPTEKPAVPAELAAPRPPAKDCSVLNLDLKPLDSRGTKTLTERLLWDEVEERELVTYVARLAANNALKDGGTITAGDLGTFYVKTKAITFSEPLVFTKDNIDQYLFRTMTCELPFVATRMFRPCAAAGRAA